MIDLGTVRPGSTIRIPFSSFDKDDGSSITMTNFAAADILVYKDGSTTERASTSGYTATTDFDTKTGKHLTIIDLADNTTAGFWNAGSEYLVAIDAVTIDAVTTGGWVARFRIGYPNAVLDTTIATLASQTSFTLTVGPAEDDALNGMWVIIHDIASAVQLGWALISDYTGATKTVTLVAGTTFTAAAGDNISVMFPAPLQPTVLGAKLDVSATGEAGLDWANIGSPTTAQNLSGTTVKTATDVATVIGTPSDLGGGATLAANLVVIEGQTDDIGAAGAGLTAVPWNAAWDAEVQSEVDDALVAQRLDELLNADSDIDGAAPPTVGSVFHELLTKAPAGFTYDQTTDSLEAIADGGGAALTAQEVRDAMKLAPTAGAPAAGSVDEHLDDILTDTTEIGAAGAGLTNINLPDQTMNITGNITGNLSGSVGSVTGAVGSVGAGGIAAASFAAGAIDAAAIATDAIDADAIAADAVTEIWAKALTELGAVPGVTASILDAMNWVFTVARNKIEQTATTSTLRKDDGTTGLATSTVSDDGVTFTRGEWS